LQGPLQRVAEAIGVAGKTVPFPAAFGIPARDVDLIYIILLVGLTLVLGWKVPLFAAVVYVMSQQQGRSQHQQQQQQSSQH
jgi:uncharacterized membrane protein YphA (DoxX/SURF4 family)